MTTKPIETQEDLEAILKPMTDLVTEDQFKEMVCTMIGHSRIISTDWGYVHCARCNAQIGDTLAGAFNTAKNVIVG